MKTKMDSKMETPKTFNDLCDMISFAKQCMSQDLDVDEYKIYDNIRKVLKYINIDALILPRQSMVIKNTDNVSNIIFCHDDIDCVFINNNLDYVLYYCPNNKNPSLLVQRFLSIHYPKAKLVVLTSSDYNNKLYITTNWISVLLFVITTNTHKQCNNMEMIDILSKQFNDNDFRRMFDDFCNVIISPQSSISRIDMTRPHGSKSLSNETSQNLNKILDIMYDIVSWSFGMIKDDENVRITNLYCILINSIVFERAKKHIKISKNMVNETVLKLWNRLNYDLKLNVDNAQSIKTTFQNIMYCLNTHYKYLVYILINLLQCNNADDIIYHHSFVIMKLTEEYDEKVKNLTKLADDMNSLICDVIKNCKK